MELWITKLWNIQHLHSALSLCSSPKNIANLVYSTESPNVCFLLCALVSQTTTNLTVWQNLYNEINTALPALHGKENNFTSLLYI